MQSVLDNTWFSAHIGDLLYHASALCSFEDVDSSQLREMLIREYALCLFSHESLWSVGVLYLDNCPTLGLPTLEVVLPRIPCQSEYKFARILAIAERRKLTTVASSICRVIGRRALNNGRLGAAVAWAVRAQDSFLATHAADAVLKSYLQDLNFASTDLLDSLGTGLLASDRLAFLGKYREFHRLYSKNEFRTAASLLVALISSRIAPK
jgi:nuclear pore complex protein Nup85